MIQRQSNESLFDRVLPLPIDGFDRKYSLLHQLSKKPYARKTAGRHYPGTSDRPFRDRPLQLFGRRADELPPCDKRYDPNCRRDHSFHPQPQDDFSSCPRCKRKSAPRSGAVHCSSCSAPHSGPVRAGGGDDLFASRGQQLDYAWSHSPFLGSFAHYLNRLFLSPKTSRLERNHGARKTHGPHLDSHRSTDVHERPRELRPSHACSVKLTVAYDGTNYFGWQKTNSGPSIQETLENVLKLILQHPIQCEAASRTDRGVHAKGQIVQFFSSKIVDPRRLLHALNGNLPRDIRTLEAALVDSTFHPTLSAQSKLYTYDLCLGPVQQPFCRKYSWHYPYPIDIALMQQAADQLIGTYDFSAFSTEPQLNSIRTLYSLQLTLLSDCRLRISIHGDKFLYKMARTIAGTLVNIGSGKLPPDTISKLLENKKRNEAGITAPAHGLTLQKILY